MAEIDGFKYESWERSSGVARRDYHAAKGGPEELPHRKAGGKKPKRYKGCPERGGSAHIYVWIEYHGKRCRYYRDENNHLQARLENATWWKQTCIGCEFVKTTRHGWYSWFTGPEEVYEVRNVGLDRLY